ncbi:AraC family transcriptional regulator [Frondihabitans cladoniiphilus]|uniref:HTH araC/xylS-type domain-containing protein n=1 Tax=Frondihabitans cladoniiphilus TaxID=715785 RepID=A0ABP8VMU3_9MICO
MTGSAFDGASTFEGSSSFEGASSFGSASSFGNVASQPREDLRFHAQGTSPDEAAAAYGSAYGGRFEVTPPARDFSFRYAFVGNDRLTLRTSASTGTIAGEIPHLRDYVVSWFRTGSGLLDWHRFTRHGTTTEPFLFPLERSFGLRFAPHRQNLVHFAPDFLEGVATEFHSGPSQRVSFDHEADAQPAGLARWRTALTDATSAIIDRATAPLLRFNAELMLARVLLVLFPWRAWDVPRVLREPSGSKARVALDFIQHHAHEPITPADAARAAGIHTRSLQQATQRTLGMSPTTYLRNVRLDRARTELLRHDAGTTTVAAVARDWGFGNLGRFASTYQARFGEKPNQTLRK